MSIKYSVKMFGNPNSLDNSKRAHARVQLNKTMSMQDFADHISKHGCKYDRGDIYAVLYNATRCLEELVLEGNKVEFGDLGYFYPTIHSETADSIDTFTVNNIKGVTINWEKPEKLGNMIAQAELQQVSTRAAQAASLRAEKEGKNNANWDKTDNTTENDSAVTPDDDNLPASGGSGTDNGGSGEEDPNV